MKYIVAPDKFKGSLSGIEFCNAVEEGILLADSNAEIVKVPLADGGDGTMDALLHAMNGKKITTQVHNPVFELIEASYLWVPHQKLAVIEMAQASGLSLLAPQDRNCRQTSSIGTGELILHALHKGATSIVLAIGGSATNDGGIGMAHALGYEFIDKNGSVLKPIGDNLELVDEVKTNNVVDMLNQVQFQVACDVKNLLYGVHGAAYVYGAQKGASPSEIEKLDVGMQNFAEVLKKQFGVDCQKVEGAGAAGGMGAGAMVFLGADLISGIDLVKNITQFDKQIQQADWIITGEGRLDSQTLSGKTIQGVLASAKLQNKPVAAFCGNVSLSAKEQKELGIHFASAVAKGPCTLQEAMEQAYNHVKSTAFNFANLIQRNVVDFVS
ncbi:glycerate kinase [Ochrovirga pacifica]|uniref:glycerate kinase n=1 Tax=Ochrovirga pacifica TaxID=1042376 RepID=UPI000255A7B5|nr:glycerate kinase [Ochrovirga pacifica]